MSGAADTAKKAAVAVTSPIWVAPKAAFNLAAEGKNPFRDVGDSVRTVVGNTNEVAIQPFMEGMAGEQAVPNIADPVDPAAEADKAKKERARVKRQAEIDILTDRPGRGGTILTDQYTYNV